MFKHPTQSLKVVLSVLVFVIFTVLGFVILTGGLTKKETATTPPGPGTVATSTTTPSITMEEAQKQFKEIQDQVTAGTLSPEEAAKLMKELGPKIAPPPLPTKVKK